jgi:hypothetical protein
MAEELSYAIGKSHPDSMGGFFDLQGLGFPAPFMDGC